MWPRNIVIHGIDVPVYSLEELESLIARFGAPSAGAIDKPVGGSVKKSARTSLSNSDMALLKQFVEGGTRGLTNKEIGGAINRQGKGIRQGLETFGTRVGLVEEGFAFMAVMRADGRGYRLTDHALRVAKSITEGHP